MYILRTYFVPHVSVFLKTLKRGPLCQKHGENGHYASQSDVITRV